MLKTLSCTENKYRRIAVPDCLAEQVKNQSLGNFAILQITDKSAVRYSAAPCIRDSKRNCFFDQVNHYFVLTTYTPILNRGCIFEMANRYYVLTNCLAI